MSTPVRIAGFVLGLVAVFLVARGVGAVVPPVHDVPVEEVGVHGH
jgi:hypothetical protein